MRDDLVRPYVYMTWLKQEACEPRHQNHRYVQSHLSVPLAAVEDFSCVTARTLPDMNSFSGSLGSTIASDRIYHN